MGIKGIYAELGPGQRVSLAKLASETLEKSGRPLRIAVDISIWQFQVQAAQEPIFVFDGPRKPVFKRNKRSTQGDRTSTALARRLVKLFGFQTHDAPGEAEADEDVDTIMFGCSKTLRNWSAEVSNVKGSKAKSNTPTHITMYSVDDEHFIKSGLDREGMVLVALMSGGDYLPEGIPGCGPKVACEAARAGFGKSLCRLKRSDEAGLRRWRDSLIKELRTNESGFFRTKHKALAIPDDFPNLEVLRYYTHPVVSEAATVERLKTSATWSKPVDVVPLRGFTDEIFDWTNRIGAEKLVRVLAPGLLVQKLMHRSRAIATHAPPLAVAEQEEAALVAKISGRRTHVSTDGMQELRAHFVPADVVGLDLEAEPEDAVAYARDGLALNSDDEFAEGEAAAVAAAAAPKKTFDPTKLDAVWISESILKLGSPLTVEDFEAAERKKMAKKKAPAKTLDNWLKVTKAVNADLGSSKPAPASSSVPEPPRKVQNYQSPSGLVDDPNPTSVLSRSGVTAEGSPTRRKGSSAKVSKAGGAAQQKILFPVSKSASDRLGKKTGSAHREPLLELIGGEEQRRRGSARAPSPSST
ncbi:unnamed protein product [Parascedosporium putredinis]|uniref:XPG-I domain-containing protein n=1 Tax=Parascedosporium putredinis TaxID=1442378 RepID=A0A9P1GX63_9PEZI|nr:unnamed protein product [Parascedosporium putredinis]CAI7988729.1 unnamed protein product [Parascedosporium putredinis]